MIIVENLLFFLLMFISVVVSISDLREGNIPNKLLIFGLSIGTGLDFIYYWKFEQSLIESFLVNLVVVSLISILFYVTHVWSAGDSKLSILLMFLIPAKIYSGINDDIAPCILIFIFIFSIGFIYVICESIVLAVKRGDHLSLKGIQFNFRHFITRFFSISAILFMLNQLISIAFPTFLEKNSFLILFINLFIILLTQNSKWLNKPIFAVSLVLICIGIALLTKAHYAINWRIYIIVALVILLRSFAEKYNYEVVKVSEVKSGMIISLGTIIQFQHSHVKDLPKYTTEDLRTKLTDEEVEAIQRWENSKYGEKTIVIVRKLPFAIIISISTILFILTEVFLI